MPRKTSLQHKRIGNAINLQLIDDNEEAIQRELFHLYEDDSEERFRHTLGVFNLTSQIIAKRNRWAGIDLVDMQERDSRLSALEDRMEHTVQPILKQFAKHLEYHPIKDPIPGAASAEYEWLSRITELTKTADQISSSFDDLATRLSCYSTLIDQTNNLLKLARSVGDRHLRTAVLTFYDALCSKYSEDLTRAQFDVIKEVLKQLKNHKWNVETVRTLDKLLRETGFETIPSDKFMSVHSEQSHV